MAESGDVASTLAELGRRLADLEQDLRVAVAAEPAADEGPRSQGAPDPGAAPSPTDPQGSAPIEAQPVEQWRAGDEDPQTLVDEARRRITELRAELDGLARAGTTHAAGADWRTYAPPPPPGPAAYAAPLREHPPSPEETYQHGAATVDVGYFRDVASLAELERALGHLPGVAAARVRSFGRGRALIDVQLAHPVALGAEIPRFLGTPCVVTSAGPRHLTLELTG